MNWKQFISSIINSVLSFPAIILLLVVIFRKQLGDFFKLVKKSLEEGWLHSLKIGILQLEWSKLEHYRLIEIPSPNFGDYEGFVKSTYDELPKIIQDAFERKKLFRILNVNLKQNIGSAPLYLYIRRLLNYFDLKVIVFNQNNNFFGLIGVKEFLYFIERKHPKYDRAYESAIDTVRTYMYDDKMEIERRIIEEYRKIRGESQTVTDIYVKQLFGKSLFTDSFEFKEKLFKSDLDKLVNLETDFIPIIHGGKYKGVFEKQKLMQDIYFNLFKEIIREE